MDINRKQTSNGMEKGKSALDRLQGRLDSRKNNHHQGGVRRTQVLHQRIQPQPGGPRFRVYRNFDVIRRYNNSVNYAIGVGHLSDRIIGGGGFEQSWPRNERPLSRKEVEEMQSLLTRRGFTATACSTTAVTFSCSASSGRIRWPTSWLMAA